MPRKRTKQPRPLPKQYEPIRLGERYNPRSVDGLGRANTVRNRRIQNAYLDQLRAREATQDTPLWKKAINFLVGWMFAPIRPGR